jgi:hypothetical protein
LGGAALQHCIFATFFFDLLNSANRARAASATKNLLVKDF